MKKLTAEGDYTMPVLSEHEKQRLINFCKADLSNWSPDGDYYPLLRIALAALTAKPVGEVIEMSGGPVMDGAVHLNSNRYREIKGQRNMKRMPVGTKFYAAPPVPVKQEGDL